MGDISAAHSKLGASSYSRWKACPGSVRLCEGVEQVESQYAKEGTLAHEVGEKILRGEVPADIDEEMMEAVRVYTDFVCTYTVPHWTRWIERKFDLTHYHPAFFGTADCVLYQPDSKYLIVIDYKHGKGVPVNVVGDDDVTPNPQLMYYALGALHELKLPVKTIELVIVQPRCYHEDGPIRKVLTSPVEVIDYVADLIQDAKETEKPDAKLNPGGHCRWCAAQFKCPAIKSRANELVKSPFAAITNPDASYDPAELSRVLGLLPMMEAYVDSVRSFAYREATNGKTIPGYKLVDKRANRKWVDEDLVLQKLGEMGYPGRIISQEPKLKSVAQMEKVVDKTNFEAISKLVIQESSGKSLVPDSDKRKEVPGKSSPFKELT